MKIQFNGHSPTERETVLSQEELTEIFEALKYQFITHIEYTSNFQRKTDYETPETIRIRKLCETHGVDVHPMTTDYTQWLPRTGIPESDCLICAACQDVPTV